jgi:hypothetical protein
MSGATPATPLAADVAGSSAVKRWFASAGYDADPPEEQAARLELVAAFCAHMGMDPDELVASCLRTAKTGGTAISAKGRKAMQAAIDQFVAARGQTGREAVVAGNQLRGLLIHNGVFIQGPVWRG